MRRTAAAAAAGRCAASVVAQVVHADAEQPHRAAAGLGLVEQRDARGARCSSSSRVGGVAVAARDRREVVVAHLDRHGARVELACARARRRRRAPSRRSPSRIVVEVGQVALRRCSRCPTTSARARRRPAGRRSPRASCCSQSASEPTASRSSAGIGGAHVHQLLDAARAQLARGHRARRPTARRPAAPAGSARRARARSPSGRRASASPDAILARNLFGATPADAVSPVAARISSLSRRATCHAERLAPGVLGDVEIGLVERERLDQRRDARGRARTPAATRRGTS